MLVPTNPKSPSLHYTRLRSEPLRKNASKPSFAPQPMSRSADDRATTMAEHAGAETRRCNLRLVVSGIRLQGICDALRRIDEGGHGVLMIGLTIEMEEDRLGANNAVGSSDLQPLTREAAMGTSDVSLRRHRPIADGDRAAGGQEGGGVAARLGGGET